MIMKLLHAQYNFKINALRHLNFLYVYRMEVLMNLKFTYARKLSSKLESKLAKVD